MSGMTRNGKMAAWKSEVSADAVVVGLRVDPEDLREKVRTVLEGVLEDAHAQRRNGNNGFVDDDGEFHARGGYWNTDGGSRADSGYTKAHVEDAVRMLRECGIETDFDGADALLCQFEMAEEIAGLAVAVRTEGGGKAFIELGDVADSRRFAEPFEARGMRFVPQANGFVVLPQRGVPRFIVVDGRTQRCSCERKACEHFDALMEHEVRSRRTAALRLGDEPRAMAAREAIALGLQFGVAKAPATRGRGRFRNDVAAAIWLILKAIYGADLRTSRDVHAVVTSRIVGNIPSERSFYRYAGHESVKHILRCMLTRLRQRSIALSIDVDLSALSGLSLAEHLALELHAAMQAIEANVALAAA